MKKIAVTIIVSIFVLLKSFPTHPFEVGTHRQLSEKAVSSSGLDDFLKANLGLGGGVQDELLSKPIIDWIGDGSVREDSTPRFFNHFHNPLRNWNEAGLKVIVFEDSSILWGQTVNQGFRWQDARDRYFDGLISQNQTQHETKLALTFRTLGQLIHLVQDAANPAHTRNDIHPFVKGLEGFVESLRTSPLQADRDLFNQLINGIPKRFTPTILDLPPNPLASIPVARIIDTTDPDQAAAVPSAGENQGIAEYSNSNFLSGDTIFKDFTFPRVESLGAPFNEIEPVTNRIRTYFPKIADGEMVNHFVAEGTFTERLKSILTGDQGYILDRGVFQDYAAKLLPRAIGYSAGLIDYFFRGRMSVTKSENQPSSDTLVNLNVANATSATDWPGNSETDVGGSTGKVIAVAFSDGVVLAVSGEIVLSTPLTRTPQEFEFDFSPTSIPGIADLMVVYRGPLGLEDDAVIAGFVPTVVTDDFTRVVQPNSDMGPNWTEFETQSPDIVKTTFQTFENSGDGQLELASSADCEPSPPGFPGEYGYAIWSANAFGDDQSSTATVIERIAGMGSGHPLDTTVAFIGGLGVRMQGTITNFTGYIAVWFQPHLGTLSFRVYKIVNRSLEQDVAGWTQLGADIDPVPAVGQVIKLEAKDNLITVDIDGVNVFSVLDDSPFFGGNPGFVSATEENDCNIHFNRSTWDNWIGGGVIQTP